MANNVLLEYGLCDDILIDIFLRVPVEYSVCRFKLVSKRWNRLLSTPSFRSKYQTMHVGDPERFGLLGFFQGSTFRPRDVPDQTAPRLSFLPTSQLTMHMKSRKFIDNLDCFFVGSSNGIILCGRHPSTYYVCNPVTDRWVKVPTPNSKTCSAMNVAIGFLYEEIQDKVSDTIRGKYKVVRADLRNTSPIRYDTLLIETYSSDTGVWEESVLRGSIPFLLIPRWPSTVLHGIFYWFAYHSTIAAYDPNASHNWVWLIKLPQSTGIQNFVLGESPDGMLHCGMDDDVNGLLLGFKILRLQKNLESYGYTAMVSAAEWIVLHIVGYSWWMDQYPRLIAFYPLNTCGILVKFGPRIMWCGFEDGGTLTLVGFDGNILSGNEFHLFPYFLHWPWPPPALP